MNKQAEGRRSLSLRSSWRALGVLAAAALLLSSCAKSQPTGTCSRADTTVVGRNVTQEYCTNVCPECTWTQGAS